MTLTLTPQSSNIHGHEYDPNTQRLTIQFRSGKKYSYHYVPQSAYDEFTKAKSYGSHFFKNIKGKFKHEQHSDG